MANIKSIIIEGFQSHQYSELQFEDGLNVIIGASDQGKSAVIRALRWVLFNEPRGADFIRVGESLCRVTVTLESQTIIIRERNQTGSRNRYILKVLGEEEQIFEGFSHQGVPEEVLRAHGMRKIALDEDHERVLNVGQQLEGSFLLSENGSLKAKAIGRIAGIHILDFAGRTVMKDLNRISSDRRRTEEDLQQVRQSLEEYDNLSELSKKLDGLSLLVQKIEKSEELLIKFQSFQEKKCSCSARENTDDQSYNKIAGA